MSELMPNKPRPVSAGRRKGLPLESAPFVIPEKLAAERWFALGIFAVALAYLMLFRRFVSMEPDEGIILQGAHRILNGQVLYRDFFSFYTPGSYYLLTMLFRI